MTDKVHPHVCLLCLGSNRESERQLSTAIQELAQRFRIAKAGRPVHTPAEGSAAGTADYLNQAVLIETRLTADQLETVLKEIERAHGRTPQDKRKGSVPIDMDLLKYDDSVLRPDDWAKDYVQKALAACT